MKKRIAILRGINVGGKRKLPMADLKALLTQLNFSNVITYIQSGNVVFDTEQDLSDEALSQLLEKDIANTFQLDVPVIIRSPEALKSAVETNPFLKDADIAQLHLTFLSTEPANNLAQEIATIDFAPDQFHIQGNDVFIQCEGKYHQTKLSNTFFEKKLKVKATTRNWKTVMKLLELSQ